MCIAHSIDLLMAGGSLPNHRIFLETRSKRLGVATSDKGLLGIRSEQITELVSSMKGPNEFIEAVRQAKRLVVDSFVGPHRMDGSI